MPQDEYVDIVTALVGAGIDWEPWADMIGPSLRVADSMLVWAPEHNVNGPTPRVWVVTFSHEGDDSAYVMHPSEVPDDLSELWQVDVPDGPYAIKTIIAIIKKELAA